MLINKKFEAQTLTGNPTRNSCCYALASHALNMSCSFGQSVCSIESRCMIITKGALQGAGVLLYISVLEKICIMFAVKPSQLVTAAVCQVLTVDDFFVWYLVMLLWIVIDISKAYPWGLGFLLHTSVQKFCIIFIIKHRLFSENWYCFNWHHKGLHPLRELLSYCMQKCMVE